ncbi:hypothetical protein GJ496_006268 [Pomphorhynchus laevis]|nr:hypothetical protein GJ496_006268 [Pomphorhynchus laevis]
MSKTIDLLIVAITFNCATVSPHDIITKAPTIIVPKNPLEDWPSPDICRYFKDKDPIIYARCKHDQNLYWSSADYADDNLYGKRSVRIQSKTHSLIDQLNKLSTSVDSMLSELRKIDEQVHRKELDLWTYFFEHGKLDNNISRLLDLIKIDIG